MTIPGGSGGSTGQARDHVDVPEDSETGLPGATVRDGEQKGDIEAGGPATMAVREQEPTGEGSAREVDPPGSDAAEGSERAEA